MYRIIFFLGAITLISCKSDKAKIANEELQGSWDIFQATRDGEIFDAVTGGYFEFKHDKVFQTNIPSLPNGKAFRLDGENISFDGDTLKYRVTQFADGVLTLESNIRGSAFQFMCRKK